MDDLDAAVLLIIHVKAALKSGNRIEAFRYVEPDGGDPPDPVMIGIAVFPYCDAARRITFQSQRVLAVATYYILIRPRAVVDHNVVIRGIAGSSGNSKILIELYDDLGDKTVAGG